MTSGNHLTTGATMPQNHCGVPDVEEKIAHVDTYAPQEMQSAPVQARKSRFFVWIILALLSMHVAYSSFKKLGHFQHHTPLPLANPTIIEAPPMTKRAAAANATRPPLVDFQVYPPVLTPSAPSGELVLTTGTSDTSFVTSVNAKKSACVVTQTLMVHDFAFSYGQPFVGSYTPPKCSFNRVTFNFTVTVAGRQFDRLGIMYFGSTEIWRTSTAEPTSYGIVWTYVKDVSEYLSLFNTKQTIIFDLGNLVNSVYTGIYNTTLTATFWSSEDTVIPADQIIPVSNGNGAKNQSSVFTVPSDIAEVSVKIPKRANRAVFSIAATGQINEEFWYTNVLQSDVNVFSANPDAYFLGYSPYREVQLYVDGLLAGVVLPFPIIFTGGIVPGFWRPEVGIDAFDLREDEIDITPWLPTLCDGQKHTFQIKIQALNDTGGSKGTLIDAPSYWLVSGKIFLWFDPAGSVTTGSTISYSAPSPSIKLSQSVGVDASGVNETLTYSVNVKRHLTISSTVTTAQGSSTAKWKQTLSYYNYGYIWNYGFSQVNNQSSVGVDTSSYNYKRQISYPIILNATFGLTADGGYFYNAAVERGQYIDIEGIPTFPSGLQNFDPLPAVKASYPTFQGSSLATTQNGTAVYIYNGTSNTAVSFGTTAQEMTFSGNQYGNTTDANGYPVTQSSSELYYRNVEAVNASVVYDHESLIGRSTVNIAQPVALHASGSDIFAPAKPQQLGAHAA